MAIADLPTDQVTAEHQVTADLIRTRDILVERGRCQGSFMDNAGRVCLAMAIETSVRGTEPRPTVTLHGPSRRAAAVIERLGLGAATWGSVCTCNNFNSDADVMARLEQAIG